MPRYGEIYEISAVKTFSLNFIMIFVGNLSEVLLALRWFYGIIMPKVLRNNEILPQITDDPFCGPKKALHIGTQPRKQRNTVLLAVLVPEVPTEDSDNLDLFLASCSKLEGQPCFSRER